MDIPWMGWLVWVTVQEACVSVYVQLWKVLFLNHDDLITLSSSFLSLSFGSVRLKEQTALFKFIPLKSLIDHTSITQHDFLSLKDLWFPLTRRHINMFRLRNIQNFICIIFSTYSCMRACAFLASPLFRPVFFQVFWIRTKYPEYHCCLPLSLSFIFKKIIGKRSLNCVSQYQIRLNRDRGRLSCNLKILKRTRQEEGLYGFCVDTCNGQTQRCCLLRLMVSNEKQRQKKHNLITLKHSERAMLLTINQSVWKCELLIILWCCVDLDLCAGVFLWWVCVYLK